jgi:ubiquinone/menaquinone biosynthesis C-methylase UbiE
MLEYPWPSALPGSERPLWTGHGFRVGSQHHAVLSYTVGSSGWTGELTSFHEDTAGCNHPIDRASRRDAIGQLRRHVKADAPAILEVGCSSGFMLREITRCFPQAGVIGADYVREPLDQLAAAVPAVPLLQFDLTKCPLPDQSIDAVVLLNVLEHIEDDAAAVRHLYRILKPGGVAVIEVPAGPHLYDVYDRLLMHHRRYRLKSLCAMLQECGFQIVRKSHLGCFLYPAFSAVKWWNKRFAKRSEAEQKARVAANISNTRQGGLLEPLLQLETWLGQWISYPAGIRCLVSGRKL